MEGRPLYRKLSMISHSLMFWLRQNQKIKLLEIPKNIYCGIYGCKEKIALILRIYGDYITEIINECTKGNIVKLSSSYGTYMYFKEMSKEEYADTIKSYMKVYEQNRLNCDFHGLRLHLSYVSTLKNMQVEIPCYLISKEINEKLKNSNAKYLEKFDAIDAMTRYKYPDMQGKHGYKKYSNGNKIR